MKMQVVEAIPYKNFKEQIKITKKYRKMKVIEVLDGFIYIERWEKNVSSNRS